MPIQMLPPQNNPWQDILNRLTQGMMQTAQFRMQRGMMDQKMADFEMQKEKHAFELKKMAFDMWMKQREYEEGLQPSLFERVGKEKKKITPPTGEWEAPYQYETEEEKRLPIWMKEVKNMQGVLPKLLEQGQIAMRGAQPLEKKKEYKASGGIIFDPETGIPVYQKPEKEVINEVSILSLPDTDPRKQAYIKGKKQILVKDPYFQAVGIIEETNELIGFDTRTFQTKREPIPGMPIKPGTVKSTSPVAQALADAIKEIGKESVKEPGERLMKEPSEPIEYEELPPASEHKGRIIRGTISGRRWKSDGVNWIEIK